VEGEIDDPIEKVKKSFSKRDRLFVDDLVTK
jgi:hypothetical protein